MGHTCKCESVSRKTKWLHEKNGTCDKKIK